MTPELRLDRAERVLMLMVRAGYRARQQSRAQDEKIDILIDSQIKTDEQLKSLRDGQAALQASLRESEVSFRAWLQESDASLRASLQESDASLRALLQESDASFRASLQESDASLRASLQETDASLRASLQESNVSLQAGQSRLQKVMAELAEEHKATERSLKAFLDGLRKNQNGKPPT